jgi:hypothetical protein
MRTAVFFSVPFFDFMQLILISDQKHRLKYGWLAQLVERLPYTQDVTGSSPVPPTSFSARSHQDSGNLLLSPDVTRPTSPPNRIYLTIKCD